MGHAHCMLRRDVMRADVDILLVSTYDTDGAGKFTHQLADTLFRLGYSSQVVCLRKRSNDPNTIGILDASPVHKLLYRLNEEVDRRIINPDPGYAFIHMRALSEKTALRSDAWPGHCRLIICTFLSGMLSPASLTTLREKYGHPPVLFYGVDMNLYTGGCHYSQECTGYTQNCNGCPAVPKIIQKKVQKDFEGKISCFDKIKPLMAVASSHEQYEQMSQSSLFKNADISKILMFVDSNVFGRHESIRNDLKIKYGFKRRVILTRSSSEPRKGCDLFVGVIAKIAKEMPSFIDEISIISVGDQYIANQLRGVVKNIFSPGYISDEDELSKMYTVSDIFLMSSIADSGPVMLAQSLMSGTPVISTDVGLARDLIFPGSNGKIVKNKKDMELEIITYLRKTDAELDEIRLKTRMLALNQLAENVYIDKLGGLINKILNTEVKRISYK